MDYGILVEGTTGANCYSVGNTTKWVGENILGYSICNFCISPIVVEMVESTSRPLENFRVAVLGINQKTFKIILLSTFLLLFLFCAVFLLHLTARELLPWHDECRT